ncbi:MAG: efflux RND transporter periplasmic adaptor subunit [Clostridiales bacterium]|jgi:RND family efflux transporter MFP subunit|nr:efflux RND transporter periplasmic adaptor subunit [Clostridiales bacterium]
MKKKIINILIIATITGLVVWKLVSNKKEMDEISARSLIVNPTVPVRVEQVKMQSLSGNISVDGRIQAASEVTLYSKAHGVVLKKYKKVGDAVSKGTVIAQVENNVVKESLSLAKMNLANMEIDAERYKKLAEGGAVTQREYEAILVAYREAQRAVTELQDQLDNTTLVSPVSGILETDYFEEGTLLSVGSQVADFVNLSQLKAVFNITESDVYRIRKGDKVVLTTDVLPGNEFTGMVDVIGSKSNSLLNYQLEVKITDKNAGILKAGMYVSATIATDNKADNQELFISRTAIVESLKNPEIYVVKDNKAYKQKITVGAVFEKYITVTDGLKEGEQVVVAGQINLVNGRDINIINQVNNNRE